QRHASEMERGGDGERERWREGEREREKAGERREGERGQSLSTEIPLIFPLIAHHWCLTLWGTVLMRESDREMEGERVRLAHFHKNADGYKEVSSTWPP